MIVGRVPNRDGARYVPRTMQELPRGTGLGRVRLGPRHLKAAPWRPKRHLKKSRADRRALFRRGLQDPSR